MDKPTDFNDMHKLAGLEAVKVALQGPRAVEPIPSPVPAIVAAPERKRLFISAAEMLSRPVEIKPLIGKLIERASTGQLFGPSGHGKTFAALDMALSVGTGGDWNGHQCERGAVLYFAGEGHAGLMRRVKAWDRDNGYSDLSSVHISASIVSFDTVGISAVIAEVRELEAHAGTVALIIVDTLARHIQGDENSTRDMSDFVKAVDGMRDAFPGSTALVIHHTGNHADNADRSRGSSALKAACDFEIRCNDGQLTFTKMKDGEAPPPIDFKLVPVEIGTDESGEPITSCIMRYGERSAKNQKAKGAKLSREQSSVLHIVAGAEGITVDDARAEYTRRKTAFDTSIKLNSIRKSFSRALETLTEKGEVVMKGEVLTRRHRGHEGTFSTNVPHGEGTGQDIYLKVCPECPPCPLSEDETEGEEIESFCEDDFFLNDGALPL